MRGEPELLAACYRNSLRLAVEHKLRSIAFPCISTGVYRFPAEMAAGIAVETVRAFQAEQPEAPEVVFCCFSAADLAIYQSLLTRAEWD